MNQSMQQAGENLIREGERILLRDAQRALDEEDFNLAVRRAQEAVELTLKGGLKLLGVDYPRVHDVAPVFSEQARKKLSVTEIEILERIEQVSLWLSQARAPSFYFEQDYGAKDAQRALDDAGVVLREVKKLMGL